MLNVRVNALLPTPKSPSNRDTVAIVLRFSHTCYADLRTGMGVIIETPVLRIELAIDVAMLRKKRSRNKQSTSLSGLSKSPLRLS
jgi:hypothetical protein